jgi:hypothetical protein
MIWREWISERYADCAHEQRPEFGDGATPERIVALEAEIGQRLPAPLRELLLESNGVDLWMHCQDRWFEFLTVVWSCDQIAEKNRSLHADPRGPARPPDGSTALFFAEPSVDGLLFAFFVRPSGPDDPAVYTYFPIEHKWEVQAPSLKDHLHGWVG